MPITDYDEQCIVRSLWVISKIEVGERRLVD